MSDDEFPKEKEERVIPEEEREIINRVESLSTIVLDYALRGIPIEIILKELEISNRDFLLYAKNDPDFLEAIKLNKLNYLANKVQKIQQGPWQAQKYLLETQEAGSFIPEKKRKTTIVMPDQKETLSQVKRLLNLTGDEGEDES